MTLILTALNITPDSDGSGKFRVFLELRSEAASVTDAAYEVLDLFNPEDAAPAQPASPSPKSDTPVTSRVAPVPVRSAPGADVAPVLSSNAPVPTTEAPLAAPPPLPVSETPTASGTVPDAARSATKIGVLLRALRDAGTATSAPAAVAFIKAHAAEIDLCRLNGDTPQFWAKIAQAAELQLPGA